MTFVNIADRANSLKNRAPKKFAKKKGGRMAKVENKGRKQVFKKNVKLPKLKEAKGKCKPGALAALDALVRKRPGGRIRVA